MYQPRHWTHGRRRGLGAEVVLVKQRRSAGHAGARFMSSNRALTMSIHCPQPSQPSSACCSLLHLSTTICCLMLDFRTQASRQASALRNQPDNTMQAPSPIATSMHFDDTAAVTWWIPTQALVSSRSRAHWLLFLLSVTSAKKNNE
ncbi:hypothetical protein EJ03DRAFT_21961 [Teratosphaeria nubilosa]|uniref:Uncharacterized protein n=1 Tax=Teratosphaeria nubilosa TaxID=161662 RepID=A0A6G1LFQ3_9PEZI|nr:hypothetical protein EJ03DRAFT_21961 [Teratosphaeria nubilosa]